MKEHEGKTIQVEDLRKDLREFIVIGQSDNELLICEWLRSKFGPEAEIYNNEVLISSQLNFSYVKYGNLYSFVLACGIYVPYYDWIYTDHFPYKGKVYYYNKELNNYAISWMQAAYGYR